MYDENGFPIKPQHHHQQGPPPSGGAPSASPPHPLNTQDMNTPHNRNPNTTNQPPQQQASGGGQRQQQQYTHTTPMYDQNGFPIKQYHQQPTRGGQQQQPYSPGAVSGGVPVASSPHLIPGASSAATPSSGTGQYETRNIDARASWNSSVFDCFMDCGVCCDAALCHCIDHSRVAGVVVDNQQDTMNIPFLLMAFFGCCHCTAYYLRKETAKRYGIKESGGEAFCLGFCCSHCSSCQVHREILFHREFPGGCFANERPVGMNPPRQVRHM